MKKLWIIVAPLVSKIMIADGNPIEVLEGVIKIPEQMTETIAENLSWKMKLMLYWQAMSKVHKMIAVGLLAIVVLFILCKLFKCKKKCSCGCLGGSCKCH